MAPWLRAHASLARNLDLVLSTIIGYPQSPATPALGRSDAFF